jgi:RimJ/RimL family protein N-acetyltransferase
MREYVELALADQRRDRSLPFAIVDRARGVVIGSTRFMDIAPEHRRVEIGATWLSPAYHRSGANVEAKLLMLGYAFDIAGTKVQTRPGRPAGTATRLGIRASVGISWLTPEATWLPSRR